MRKNKIQTKAKVHQFTQGLQKPPSGYGN